MLILQRAIELPRVRSVTLKGVGLENLKYLSEDTPGSRTRKVIRGKRGKRLAPPMGGARTCVHALFLSRGPA